LIDGGDMARRFAARPRNAPRVLCAGSITHDHVYTIPERLVVGSKHRATSRFVIGGGVAANAAVAIARLGGRATLLGAVGADEVGDIVLDELRAERVDVNHIRRLAATATPESVVIVQPDGSRTIVAHASIDLGQLAVPGLPSGELSAVLVDARWPEATRAALDRARGSGVPGVVDVDRLPTDTTLLDLASHLVFSESAMTEFSGSDDVEVGLRTVAADVRAEVSVTLGERGVTWLEGDEIRHLDGFPVDAVDTTGAGDVFHGAFALALAEGSGTLAAFGFASAAAALKCSRPGARAGIPDRATVDEFLRSHPPTLAR
jgi:sulfofructose kinase